jgi:Tol biopolymer transport system component
MADVIRRVGALSGLALILIALGGEQASAAVPEGPRLAFVRLGPRPLTVEVISTNAVGAIPLTIVGERKYHQPLPFPFLSPVWFPDGSQLAFTGLTGGIQKPGGAFLAKIFRVSSEGGWSEAIPGTAGGYAPVLSADGRMLAFTRQRERRRPNEHGGEDLVYESAAIWLLDLAEGGSRQLTPWRNHLVNVASSFSPDGRRLALTRRVGGNGDESIALHLDGSGSTLLSSAGFAPRYSPDGSRVAFLRSQPRVLRNRRRESQTTIESEIKTTVTDLFVMNADGSGVHRLTKTPNLVESEASWDPSGRRLAYTQTEAGIDSGLLGFGNAIVEMNADGSCPTVVLSDTGLALFGPTWQPGPGREAGRIEC